MSTSRSGTGHRLPIIQGVIDIRSVPAKAQQRLVAAVGIVMMLALGRSVPAIPGTIDPAVYHRILVSMRDGRRFYDAIDETFRAFGMGPVDSVLAIRSPIGFWLLAAVGSDLIAWILLLGGATIAGALMSRVLGQPIHAVWVIVFFAMVGQVAWTAPELWASILVVVALALALDNRWLPAIAAATVAGSIRELAVLVLVGIIWSRRRSRCELVAAVVGLVAVAGIYLVHWTAVTPYLAAAGDGRQAELLGTGSFPGGILAMMSTWVPGGSVVGPVLFVASLVWAHRRGQLSLVAPVLGLVATGAVVDRPEWATFVVPLTLALGLDEIGRRLGSHITRRRSIDWPGANRSSASRRRHPVPRDEGAGRGSDAPGGSDLVAHRPVEDGHR